MHKKLIVLAAFFFSACATNTVLSPTYDFSGMKRIGVLAFSSPKGAVKGAENVFAKYFMQAGYTVVERAQLEKVLAEENISVSGYLSPETTKKIGEILGVDVLLTGQITSYSPSQTTVTSVTNRRMQTAPVYRTQTVANPDGSVTQSQVLAGVTTTNSADTVPVAVTIDAKVGVIAKLIDVQTAEVVWIGSDTGSSANSLDAVDSLAKGLVKNFVKQAQKQQKLNAKTPAAAR